MAGQPARAGAGASATTTTNAVTVARPASSAKSTPTWVHDDGGRKAAGFKGKTGDCVVRAIAIVTGKPYREVYETLDKAALEYTCSHNDKVARMIDKRGTSPRHGVFKEVFGPLLERWGFTWVPTMSIGSGCKVHLRADELPRGRLVANISRHVCAVIDGVVHDTYDPSREGTRCVYGYWIAPDATPAPGQIDLFANNRPEER